MSSPSGSPYTLKNITQQDVLWYSNLPEKVKRAYFSIDEERVLDIKSRDSRSGDRVKTVYKAGEASNRSLPSLQSPSSGSSSPTNSAVDSLFTKDAETMDSDLTSTFHWIDTDLDLSLHDYPQTILDSRKSAVTVPRTSSVYSFRRSIRSARNTRPDINSTQISYNEDSQPAPIARTTAQNMIDGWVSGWAPVPMLSDLETTKTARIQTMHSRKASIVSLDHRKTSHISDGPTRILDIDASTSPQQVEERGSGWAPNPSMSLTPPQADLEPPPSTQVTHYLNPEARLKLRMYLGSASKFDEAIEFGFPSLRDEKDRSSDDRSRGSTTGTGSGSGSAREFGPNTIRTVSTPTAYQSAPTSESVSASSEFFSIPYQSLSDTKSTISGDRKLDYQAQLRRLDRDSLGLMNPREMTIRMTLTRPDLRANETSLYPHQQERPRTSHEGHNKDPLQLEPLAMNETMIPITAFGQSSFSLKRLWNRK